MEINLLPPQSSAVSARTIVLSSMAAALLLGNILAAGRWWRLHSEQQQAERMLINQQSELAMLKEKAAQAEKAQELQRQSQALEKWASSRPPLADQLHLLVSLLPPRSYLTMVQYSAGGSYQVQVVLPDMESVATYVYLLQHHPTVTAVSVKSVSLQGGGQGAAGGQPARATASSGIGRIDQWLSLFPWHTEVAYASDGGDLPGQPATGNPGGVPPVPDGTETPFESHPESPSYKLDIEITISR